MNQFELVFCLFPSSPFPFWPYSPAHLMSHFRPFWLWNNKQTHTPAAWTTDWSIWLFFNMFNEFENLETETDHAWDLLFVSNIFSAYQFNLMMTIPDEIYCKSLWFFSKFDAYILKLRIICSQYVFFIKSIFLLLFDRMILHSSRIFIWK